MALYFHMQVNQLCSKLSALLDICLADSSHYGTGDCVCFYGQRDIGSMCILGSHIVGKSATYVGAAGVDGRNFFLNEV